MKNMKTIFFILFLFVSENIFAQSLSKFNISKAFINGQDMSAWSVSRKQYFDFYENETGDLCFANTCGNCKEISFSFGKILLLNIEIVKETKENQLKRVYKFEWKYFNSYDENFGVAFIEMTKIYYPTHTDFVLKMYLKNSQIDYYEGVEQKDDQENNFTDL